MITGFNTDIEYEGVTYHVQTEDKGLETPLILSLVYHRGTILASKRSPYDDLLTEFDETILAERLQKQHKLMCAAIRAGRIEDLKRMTMRESASKKKGSPALPEIATLPPEKSQPLNSPIAEKILPTEKSAPKTAKKIREEIPPPQILHLADEKFQEIKQPGNNHSAKTVKMLEEEIAAEQNENWGFPINLSAQDLIFDEVVVEEVTVLPAEAVEIVTDFSKRDAVADDALSIELLNNTPFKAGQDKTVSILIGRGAARRKVVGATVMAKVLGSNFRPLIFHAKSDSNGVAVVQLHLPTFTRGRAAVLIKVVSGGDEAELRRIIQPSIS